MSLLNKKKRKPRNRFQIIESYVHCDNCNTDIPVRGDRDQERVIRSHFSLCKKITSSSSSESSRKQNDENESNDENGHDIHDETHDDNPGTVIDLKDIEDPLKPDQLYLIYQVKLSQAYRLPLLKMNKKGDLKACVQNHIEIASYVVDNSLNTTQFDNLMILMNNVVSRECQTHSCTSQTLLPRSMKTLKKQTMNDIIDLDKDTLFELIKFEYRLDVEMFPDHEKTITAYCYDILQIISDETLNMDPTNIKYGPYK
jgi:hypothetical protein